MADLFALLPRFSWRGIEVPISGRSVSFAHEAVEHPLAFRDGVLVEMTGAKNWTFSYRVPMREEIAVAPWAALFTEVLAELVIAVRDRTPGPLEDPVYGQFRCVPMTFADELDVQRRDGVDLTLEFQHAPEDDTSREPEFSARTIRGARDDAARLDDAVEIANWEQEVPPEPTVNPLDAIDGLGRQIETAGDQIGAKLDDTAFRLEKVEETIDRLADGSALQPTRRAARRLRDSVLRLKRKHEQPGRLVRQVLRSHGAATAEVARDLGMTIQEMIALNPGLVGPYIPAGAVVYYLVDAAV